MGDQRAVYQTSIEDFSVLRTFSVDPATIRRINECVKILGGRFSRKVSQGHVVRMAVKDYYDQLLEGLEAEAEVLAEDEAGEDGREGARGVMDQ